MNYMAIATEEEKEIIEKNLAQYPTLSSIIPRDHKFYQLDFDQYTGRIPPERFEEVAEFSLGGILLHSGDEVGFRTLLEHVEGWLKLYPEYANEDFGKKLQNNFWNFASELEVYDALKRAGCSPERDVSLNGEAKNLDFKICPDGKDILIEVTTPRMRLETELMYSEIPHAGFFDYNRGIEKEGYDGPSRAAVVAQNKVITQIQKVISGTDCPVILIINNTYAYPEIMGFNPDSVEHIAGTILYRNGTSKFYPKRTCRLSEKEKLFFTHLMGSTPEERLQRILSKKE